MKADIYNISGKKAGSIDLPERVFGVSWNADLVHQVVVSMMSNARSPIAHTKDRGDVSGGGKKPWKQKGTGRARHGSIRSPIWRGGGVTFGPKNTRNFFKKINKKMKAKALAVVLTRKLTDSEIMFVEKFSFDEPKTKKAVEVLNNLSSVKGFENLMIKTKNAVLLAVDEKQENLYKSFSNLANVKVKLAKDLNSIDVLKYKYVLFVNPEEVIKFFESRLK